MATVKHELVEQDQQSIADVSANLEKVILEMEDVLGMSPVVKDEEIPLQSRIRFHISSLADQVERLKRIEEELRLFG